MSLPVPNLDDRKFQDFVDEAKRMIPSLTPEWTNHNLSDPGVALIEIFAWMSEQVIFRLNQVPDRMYVDFLNLVGVQPFPATAARARLTFWLSATPAEPVVVPLGTQVATAGDGDHITFVTTSELRIEQPQFVAAMTATADDRFTDVMAELLYDRDVVTCFPSNPVAPGDAFHLGFDRSLAGQLLELTVTTASRGIGVDPENAPVIWEAWTGETWVSCTVIADATGGLNRNGVVRLVMPPEHEQLIQSGQRRFWLRLRLLESRQGQPAYQSSPTLAAVAVGSLGGSVMAEHAQSVGREFLGRSTGDPGQSFALGNRPILPRKDGEHVVVLHDGERNVFTEVRDFSRSGPSDRHVMWDPALGIIHFGPAIRYPDGHTVQHGAIPPFGAEVSVDSYMWGGGSRGNVGAGSLVALREAVPYVDKVTNIDPARGGVDPETVDEVKRRGPSTLRTGQRAVTISDYEQLTLESTPQVARALCLPPEQAWDPVRVLVVPRVTLAPDQLSLDDFSLSPELFGTIRDHLEERRTLGASVRVTTPFFQGLSVVARVRAATGRSPSLIRQRVVDSVYSYLSPISGGPNGGGWPFSMTVSSANLTAMIVELDGVAGVDELAIFELDLRNDRRLGDALDVISLDAGSLFLGRRHQVVVR